MPGASGCDAGHYQGQTLEKSRVLWGLNLALMGCTPMRWRAYLWGCCTECAGRTLYRAQRVCVRVLVLFAVAVFPRSVPMRFFFAALGSAQNSFTLAFISCKYVGTWLLDLEACPLMRDVC